ncbi:MAG: signal peptide peptidase SppA [Candidatus Aminicenantes bacterium]|nr:signal peptide peptidase SppA [Candidatus Aminicenantes bacterium]
MKKGTYVLIIFLIFFVLIIAVAASLFFIEVAQPVAVKPNTYLEMPLSGPLDEHPVSDMVTDYFFGGNALSLHDIWVNFHKAKADGKIKGVILRIGHLSCDWAKINEIRSLVLDFKKSGKTTVAYISETMDFDKEYYLATACDHIFLHPLGSLIINGIGGHFLFLRGALDKLGIEVEVERVDEFKTAYNMFTEEKFSPSHKEMMASLYNDIFDLYIASIAEARGKTEEEVHELIDQGVFTGEKAKELDLVDALLYEDELEDFLKGGSSHIYRISHAQYLKSKTKSSGLTRGRKIALIYGVGPIHTGESIKGKSMGSSTIARWLQSIRQDSSIAAVVFRIDSPGGSAVASDIIGREVVLTKKQKPFIVSMSDMAGSGGYWVAMDAHKIVAHPQTLTGSIGVIFGKFNMMKLYKRLGISSEKLTFGRKADMFSTFRKLTPEEKDLMKEQILWSYDRFITKVAVGRNMTKEEVDKVGKGRVWTGNQAKELGLVDELGDLSKAFILAKEIAGIPESESVKLVVWPKKASFWKSIFTNPFAGIKAISNRTLDRWLQMFRIFEKAGVLAVMPCIFTTPE